MLKKRIKESIEVLILKGFHSFVSAVTERRRSIYFQEGGAIFEFFLILLKKGYFGQKSGILFKMGL